MKLRTWCIRMGQILTKTVLVFTGFLIFLILFKPAISKAEDDRGGITIRQQNAPIERVFQSIEKQSGYRFFYNETLLQGAGKVTLNLQNVSLQEALEACFLNQPLSYAIVDKTIIVKRRQEQQPKAPEVAAVALSRPGKIIALRGKVTSGKQPVAGASIMIKGTDNGASTDKEGMFTLPEVEDDATLVVSSIGHQGREVTLNGQTFVSIDLSQRTDDLDEAVVVAYNTTTRRMNTGAVTVVKGSEIQNMPNRSFEKSLQGLVPGLLITQGSGQPGGGVANFVLRGIATGADPNTIPYARNPLIVMDGIPLFQEQASLTSPSIPNNNPIAQLNPSDIESITVLKDAAAIALYGSKASNGVILVTTKKGKEGKAKVGIRHQTDFAERLKSNENVLSQDEYLELLYETYRNTNPTIYTDDAILADLKKKFPVQSDGSFYPQSDWLNALYKGGATTIANEVSVSGGNARQTYYLNLEYTKQDGVLKNTGFDRKSFRFNYENQPASWIKLGMNTAGSYSVQDIGVVSSELGAARISPLNPIRNENGELIYNYQWGGATASNPNTITTFFANPVASQELNFERNISYRGLSKLSGEVKFLKYFTLVSNLGADLMLSESKFRIHPKLSSAYNYPAGAGNISGYNTRTANLISTNSIRFGKVFSRKHSINVIAAHEAQIRTTNTLRVDLSNITSNPLTENLSSGTVTYGGGFTTKETLLSYFGQVNYGFLDRYFLSGSIRRDGSSLFGENNQFGSHWSVGGGWVVSSEPFLQPVSNWLSYFKLRGSLGSAGNSAAIVNTLRYHRLSLLDYMNGTTVRLDASSTPNPGIKWEKTFSWDAGLDMRLFKDRATFSVDLYNRKTTDFLGTVAMPQATGYASMKTNIGDMKNYGVEISFSASVINTKNFKWKLSGNWSQNKNRLIKTSYPMETSAGSASVTANSINVNAPGENYNSYYLVKWTGVDAGTGKPLWMDSTGKESSNWAAAKPFFAGKPQPDAFGSVSQSFTYKSITLSMLLNYQYGFQVYVSPAGVSSTNDGLDPYINQGKSALDRWQKPGDIATNPRRLLFGSIAGVSDNATANSTRYLIDGDFIRLSNISISYQLPKQILDRIHVSSWSIFLQGSNLGTWTKYSGRQDSENASILGRASSVYPLQRSYSIGCNLNF